MIRTHFNQQQFFFSGGIIYQWWQQANWLLVGLLPFFKFPTDKETPLSHLVLATPPPLLTAGRTGQKLVLMLVLMEGQSEKLGFLGISHFAGGPAPNFAGTITAPFPKIWKANQDQCELADLKYISLRTLYTLKCIGPKDILFIQVMSVDTYLTGS